MEGEMKLSLFNKITKELEKEIGQNWSEVTMEVIPADELRHPNDPSLRIKHDIKSAGMDWEIELNYNRSNYDEIIPVRERSLSVYYQVTLKNGDKLSRSVHIYENETIFGHEPLHSHRASIQTEVNGNVVARYRKDLDLITADNKVSKEIGWTIYKAVTRP